AARHAVCTAVVRRARLAPEVPLLFRCSSVALRGGEPAGVDMLHLAKCMLLAGSVGNRSHGDKQQRAAREVRSACASVFSRAALAWRWRQRPLVGGGTASAALSRWDGASIPSDGSPEHPWGLSPVECQWICRWLQTRHTRTGRLA